MPLGSSIRRRFAHLRSSWRWSTGLLFGKVGHAHTGSLKRRKMFFCFGCWVLKKCVILSWKGSCCPITSSSSADGFVSLSWNVSWNVQQITSFLWSIQSALFCIYIQVNMSHKMTKLFKVLASFSVLSGLRHARQQHFFWPASKLNFNWYSLCIMSSFI